MKHFQLLSGSWENDLSPLTLRIQSIDFGTVYDYAIIMNVVIPCLPHNNSGKCVGIIMCHDVHICAITYVLGYYSFLVPKSECFNFFLASILLLLMLV